VLVWVEKVTVVVESEETVVVDMEVVEKLAVVVESEETVVDVTCVFTRVVLCGT